MQRKVVGLPLTLAGVACAVAALTATAGGPAAASPTACAAYARAQAAFDAAPGREVAAAVIATADACYEAAALGGGGEPLQIDEGGVWLTDPGFGFLTFGTKWGAGSPYAGGQDVPGPGLPGGTVTYSFMPDGVTDSESVDFGPDTITAISSLPGFQACFLDEIRDAFLPWAEFADIDFEEVADDGLDFNTAGAVGDIRIGGHPFDGEFGILAHAFFPPPNGTYAAGDMHFDVAEPWTCDDAGIDIGIVAMHEIGHSIGLGHQALPVVAVMNPIYNPSLLTLQTDDWTGARSIYGYAIGGVGFLAERDVSPLRSPGSGGGADAGWLLALVLAAGGVAAAMAASVVVRRR